MLGPLVVLLGPYGASQAEDASLFPKIPDSVGAATNARVNGVTLIAARREGRRAQYCGGAQMSDTAGQPDPRASAESEEGPASDMGTSHDDPTATEHPTGQQQADENEENELPG